ncbi:LysR family transcriptional regulator [Labilithrix luteola]|nr:LysR family transcriptional regulator [Labilithrix luteola]
MISLDGGRLFVAVARQGSFVEAARRTGVPTSTVSRHIAELEEAIGVRLFQRTSRKVSLTSDGARLFERVGPLFDELSTALDAAADREEEPAGTLRVTAPVVTGASHVAPLLFEFSKAHPKVSVELELTNAIVDLVEDRFDLAFRIGPVEGADLVARRIWSFPYGLAASPRFVDDTLRGRTQITADELVQLPALVTSRRGAWRLRRKDGTRDDVRPSARILVNDPRVAVEGATRGLGIVCAPLEMLTARKNALTLLGVRGRTFEPREIFIVYPSRRLVPSRVRAAVDWFFRKSRRGGA